MAASIAQAGGGGNFNSTWFATLRNIGVGLVTLTPATSQINGAATLVLSSGQSTQIYSDGSNYWTLDGRPAGHEEYTGTAPGVTAGAADCGTSPSVVGNDNTGRITVGSSTNGGKCTLTFATSWTNAPACTAMDETTTVALRPASPSQTTVAFTGAIVAGDKISYQCSGYH